MEKVEPQATKREVQNHENPLKNLYEQGTGKLSNALPYTFGKRGEKERTNARRREKAKQRQEARGHGKKHCSDFRRELELMHGKVKQGKQG